jgi:hypothetical protein
VHDIGSDCTIASDLLRWADAVALVAAEALLAALALASWTM